MNAAWQSVLEPGRSPAGPPALPETKPGSDVDESALETLRFLAALSWLSYFPYASENGGRGERLAALDFEERLFLSCSGVDCSLVVPIQERSSAYVIFRGTVGFRQWVYNVDAMPRTWSGDGRVHAGFARALSRVWPHLKQRLDALAGDGATVFFTGHSLGGALATLAAALWDGDPAQSQTATFGAPHAGNAEFAVAYSKVPIIRVTRGGDPVPDLPAPVSAVSRLNYTHVGTPLVLPGQSEPRPGNRLTIRQWRDALERRDPPAFLADHAPSGYVQALAEA
ncbi:lipase family protein [Verrucomicrobiales bacterium]|nr:lipase family protein [Verrucomicrobiales bacterium]